jgi:hypothetical protein
MNAHQRLRPSTAGYLLMSSLSIGAVRWQIRARPRSTRWPTTCVPLRYVRAQASVNVYRDILQVSMLTRAINPNREKMPAYQRTPNVRERVVNAHKLCDVTFLSRMFETRSSHRLIIHRTHSGSDLSTSP